MRNMSNINVSVAALIAFLSVLFLGSSPLVADPITVVLPRFAGTASAGAPSRTALLSDRSFVNLEVREISRNPDGSAVLEYVVTLENTGATIQADHAGPELALYLPAGVQVNAGTLSATLGSVTVTGSEGQAIGLEWNGELAGASTAKARRKPGKTTSTTTTTVTTQITVPDLPIQGVVLVLDSEGEPLQ